MSIADHPFLARPGVWRAEGTFFEKGETARPARGRTTVRHHPDRWTIDGEMEVLEPKPERFANTYVLSPPEEHATVLPWHAQNPAVGNMKGRFILVAESILSTAKAERSGVWATETMVRVDDDHYEARGVFVMAEEVVSSWAVTLRREA